MVGLNFKRALREGELFNLPSHILNKHVSHINKIVDFFAPNFPLLFTFLLLRFLSKRNKTFFLSLESGGEGCTPPTIREVIPSLSAVDVALLIVCPEDGADIFA